MEAIKYFVVEGFCQNDYIEARVIVFDFLLNKAKVNRCVVALSANANNCVMDWK